MKKTTLSVLFSTTVLALFLFSCSKDDKTNQDPFNSIYGYWEVVGLGYFNPTNFQVVDTTHNLIDAPDLVEILESGKVKYFYGEDFEEAQWKDDVLKSHIMYMDLPFLFKVTNDDFILVVDPIYAPEYYTETSSYGLHLRKAEK